MKLSAMIKCPYCDFDVSYKTDEEFDTQLVTCPLDGGGCDRRFVVDSTAYLVTNIYKVEGENNG